MLFFDLLYKYFITTLKVYRILKTCKNLSNWKPMTDTYHRDLEFFFFRIPLNRMHSTQNPWKGQAPLCFSCEYAGRKGQWPPLMDSTVSGLWGLGPRPGASTAHALGRLSVCGGEWVVCVSSRRPQCPGSLAPASESPKQRRPCFLFSPPLS